MKKTPVVFLLLILFIADVLALSGCSSTRGGTATVFVDYAYHYENLQELASAADLIIAGTIMDSGEIKRDAATSSLRMTRFVLRPHKVLKGIPGPDGPQIIVSQTGAAGWGAEDGNPLFYEGEECFLFLKYDENSGVYYLMHPDGRFRIEDGKVSSLNFVLPTGQARPPQDLIFWQVELDEFVRRVEEALAVVPIDIPEEDPIIQIDLSRTMMGSGFELSIYEDGEVIYIKSWNLRLPVSLNPPTRSWRTGEIAETTFAELETLFQTEEYGLLKEKYYSSMEGGNATVIKAVTTGDMWCHIRFDYAGIQEDIYVSRYTTPDKDETYPGMPYPLNDLYALLRDIGENRTEEVHREIIAQTINYEFPDQ
ncbi:MAG: hypothetical protein JW712_08080 [Dehalococcoidales bacterium]|nr:hypothetical protein [Dehalococcoidales bacterium]